MTDLDATMQAALEAAEKNRNGERVREAATQNAGLPPELGAHLTGENAGELAEQARRLKRTLVSVGVLPTQEQIAEAENAEPSIEDRHGELLKRLIGGDQ